MQMHTSAEMSVFGNLTNNGFFAQNRGRIHFVGSTQQLVDGRNAMDFQRVVLNNGQNLSLRVPVIASSELEFKNGMILTPRSNPRVFFGFDDGAVYRNESDERQINGYCARIGMDSFRFPIGDGLQMRPAAISASVMPNDTFSAAYFRGAAWQNVFPAGGPYPPNQVLAPVLKISNTEYWDVSGKSVVRITLFWNSSSRVDTLVNNNLGDLIIAGWNGREWMSVGRFSVTGTIENGQITSDPIVPDSFRVFALARAGQNTRCISTAPTLALGNNRYICNNEPIVLTLSSRYNRYLWSDGSTDSTIVVRRPGPVWVTVWDNCNVAQRDTISILNAAAPGAAQAIATSCNGRNDGRIVLRDTAGLRLTLNGKPVTTAGLSGLAPGIYDLKLTTQQGCSFDTTVVIVEPPLNRISIGKDTMHVDFGKSLTLTASSLDSNYRPTTYAWTPPQDINCTTCQTVTVRPLVDVTYKVTARDSSGCLSEDQVQIFVNKKVYIPTAFRPDDEGFTILAGEAVVKVRKMQIFDRWGALIFEASDFKPDGSVRWDGTFKGQPLNAGTFVVTAEIEFYGGEVRKFANEFLLAR